MVDTVFYAWQSDLPANVNRTFIRDCLDRALDALNSELGIEDAIRADQDTQGVAGDINIAEVIFGKIDTCRAFVADVTTVTPEGALRPSPNPNVLVEYGRASVRPGSGCIVTIFNEAYGNWETDRPFDLRHRRRPLLYSLPSDHTPEEKAAARRVLVSALTNAVREILSASSPSLVAPEATSFSVLRDYYGKTTFRERTVGRIIGFWCGLIPHDPRVRIVAPWDQQNLFDRDKERSFRLNNSSIPFRSIDSSLPPIGPRFNPMQNAAQLIWQYNYPRHAIGSLLCDDAVGVYVTEGGCVILAARTNNLDPEPFLQREWIMVEVANSLAIMERVRRTAGLPSVPYSLMVEIRYDQQAGEELVPVPSGHWRLGSLGDEQHASGPVIPSRPLSIGPITVGAPNTFPSVLQEVYTRIVTSAQRRPESGLSFET